MQRVLVTGAGGFVGHHLVSHLKRLGHHVRGVDLRQPEFEPTVADEFLSLDLRLWENALAATRDVDRVYALAADMGGIGYISDNHSRILYNNTLISFHTLEAARTNGVRRYLHGSSACVYPLYRQETPDAAPLREGDAYPAQPQEAYGWEKLVTEILCGHYDAERRMETRIARFHNIYGPLGAWRGGREKAPAALCRKVAEAKLVGRSEIEIWGDGQQTRTFCYVDDCVEGMVRLMESAHSQPLNLGREELVTISRLADTVAEVAGIEIVKRYVPGPQGVRGRAPDNAQIREVLGWEPRISLNEGLRRTYPWIEGQVQRHLS